MVKGAAEEGGMALAANRRKKEQTRGVRGRRMWVVAQRVVSRNGGWESVGGLDFTDALSEGLCAKS